MKAIKGRSARRRTSVYALEFLEGRALLSHVSPAAAVSGIHAEATKVITSISGRIVGASAPAPTLTPISLGYHGYSGHGSTSIGQVFLGFKYVATTSPTDPTIQTLTSGSGQLTTLKGKEIDLVLTGMSIVRNAAGTLTLRNLTGSVVSGTGPFDGATGSFVASGTTHANGKFTLTFNIALNPVTA
jgi:hypothetical protein